MMRIVEEPHLGTLVARAELAPRGPIANRDREAFDRPDEVIIDRAENRHVAFGLGIHRCAGSHLARMELRVALEVWLQAFGAGFELDDPDAVRWSGGQVRGPRCLPVRITG